MWLLNCYPTSLCLTRAPINRICLIVFRILIRQSNFKAGKYVSVSGAIETVRKPEKVTVSGGCFLSFPSPSFMFKNHLINFTCHWLSCQLLTITGSSPLQTLDPHKIDTKQIRYSAHFVCMCLSLCRSVRLPFSLIVVTKKNAFNLNFVCDLCPLIEFLHVCWLNFKLSVTNLFIQVKSIDKLTQYQSRLACANALQI